jgi:CubicO group peptidase (beta-lactamase class C family)
MSYLSALEKLRDLGMHGMVMARDGETVAEAVVRPYRLDKPHTLNSVTKSFVSVAVGFCIQEGLLSLDYKVREKMTVRHLLMMATGHTGEPYFFPAEQQPLQSFMKSAIQAEPGSVFFYNTPATHVLGYIVEKVSGQSIEDYLRPRLFEPLGISEWKWDKHPDGSCMGGVGLWLSTRDLVKFGNFLLFEGKGLLNADWIREAASAQIIQPGGAGLDWTSGYGYQFWMNRTGGYRADGAFGQFCVVLPAHRLVIAVNSGSHDMEGMLAVILDELAPGTPDSGFMELDPPDSETEWQAMFRKALLEDAPMTYQELFG